MKSTPDILWEQEQEDEEVPENPLGYKLSRKRVQSLMRLMGLASLAPMKRTTVTSDGHKIYPYLLRNLDIDRPEMVRASDISTYG